MSISSPPPDRPALNVSKLRVAISEQRFARYLTEAGGDERLAWQLYEWGLDVASALHLPLHAIEITLRNRIFESIGRVHGRTWLTHPSRTTWLREYEIEMIDTAHRQVSREGRTVVSPDDLVAALPFGFWVGLVAGFHDQGLWRQATYRAFSGKAKRRDLHDHLDRVRTLRNRVAHHEHLLNRDLDDDLDRIDTLLKSLNAEVAAWVTGHSPARGVISNRPTRNQS
jgi:hypothetical protein